MRKDIRFRFWHKEKKYMTPSTSIWYINLIDDPIAHEGGWAIMQDTALKDKNGKSIYEGDIIHVSYFDNYKHKEVVGVVEWSTEFWGWGITNYDYKVEYAESYEVIGNIYKNQDLLK